MAKNRLEQSPDGFFLTVLNRPGQSVANSGCGPNRSEFQTDDLGKTVLN